MEQCDEKLNEQLQKLVEKNNQADLYFDPKSGKKKVRYQNSPKFKIEDYAFQMSDGVKLLEIEGVSYDLLLTLVTEVGLEDITTKFPSKKHLVSWLALCPNKKVSGGKVLSSKVGKGNKNLRGAFISASVGAAKVKGSYLQSFYYRIKSSADGKVAKMATAKKIAEIVYTMLKNKTTYDAKMNLPKRKIRSNKALKE